MNRELADTLLGNYETTIHSMSVDVSTVIVVYHHSLFTIKQSNVVANYLTH